MVRILIFICTCISCSTIKNANNTTQLRDTVILLSNKEDILNSLSFKKSKVGVTYVIPTSYFDTLNMDSLIRQFR